LWGGCVREKGGSPFHKEVHEEPIMKKETSSNLFQKNRVVLRARTHVEREKTSICFLKKGHGENLMVPLGDDKYEVSRRIDQRKKAAFFCCPKKGGGGDEGV